MVATKQAGGLWRPPCCASWCGGHWAHGRHPPQPLFRRPQDNLKHVLLHAQYQRWCEAHGKLMRPPKLHPAIYRTVREWFELVDDDGSGTLEHHELVAALQVRRRGRGGCLRQYQSAA